MRKLKLMASLFVFLICFLTVGFTNLNTKTAKSKSAIKNTLPKAAKTTHTPFDKMMAVLMHKRCINCHPAGDTPLQGEDSHFHNFNVLRGPDDHGLAAYTCQTCHTTKNNTFSGVPGAPHWALAPIEMAWEGKTRIEIATQMMDSLRNGGKSTQEIMKHLTEDELVLWAWKPGVNAEGIAREPPPVSKKEFIKAVKVWIANGAIIPEN